MFKQRFLFVINSKTGHGVVKEARNGHEQKRPLFSQQIFWTVFSFYFIPPMLVSLLGVSFLEIMKTQFSKDNTEI